MKRKIRIGIPRGLLYYRDYILWKTFFEGIGCTLILSPPTNKGIIDKGGNISIDESCLPAKIYLGHVKELSQKCDYILVPRICNYAAVSQHGDDTVIGTHQGHDGIPGSELGIQQRADQAAQEQGNDNRETF